jgi:hypothetical protein
MISLEGLRQAWQLLSAVFIVGAALGVVLVPLVLLAREVYGAKAIEGRRTR